MTATGSALYTDVKERRVVLTVRDAIQTLRLAHEAVKLPHLADCDLVPAVLLDYALDFLAQERSVFGAAGELVYSLGDTLRGVDGESTVDHGAVPE